MSDEQAKKRVQDLIRKAARSIAAAKRHVEHGDYDFASSRAYYAAFYAMEASLLTKNLVFTRLFRDRQIGDYEFDVSIGAREAKEDILSAERIVEAVETYLRRGVLSR